jgi:riboflavin kinase/FMN adenylyltransferase
MGNLGGRPTIGDGARLLEVHCFDAARDWYGAEVRVDFVARVRDIRAFPGLEALRTQLADDERAARALLAETRPAGLATANPARPLG